MIHLHFDNIDTLTATHYNAVRDYVVNQLAAVQDELYLHISPLLRGLPAVRPAADCDRWLKPFILADTATIRNWVNTSPHLLDFDFFLNLYTGRFSTNNRYVDSAKTYNAYTLLQMMDIQVCPYCDDEFFDILNPDQGLRRTSEFDHFYPKGKGLYPGLAMCFFNLIPSGKTCNQLMNKFPVAANPYDSEIENWSKFEPAIPFGANLDSLPLEAFSVTLTKHRGMIQNDATLALEQRYNHRHAEIRDLLIAARDFSDEKCRMMIRIGIDHAWIESAKRLALGNPYPVDKGQRLHQKLKHDLTGY